MAEYKKHHRRYHTLSAPFASIEEADDAVKAFHKELAELRVKHKIPDLFVVMGISFQVEANEEGDDLRSIMVPAYMGDQSHQERLAAFGFGVASAERQEETAKVVEHAKKAIRKPRE